MYTISSNLGPSEDQVDFEPEVELISLISETLPHYKLRADYSVRFSGYQHSDFNRAEQVKEDISELTNQQIHQTLEYFILCGLRVNRMTETYEDCQALTMLVQEQRSHLDLAANIGLNLVEKNTQLEQRVVSLEEQLESSKQTIKQMRHQLSLKDDLLRMFHSEIEESEDQIMTLTEPCDAPFMLDKVNVKQLETKLNRLEEENLKLRDKQHTITSNTDLLETKETQLVNDCVSHILESTKTIDRLSVELNKKTNDYLNQHEEISRLLTSKIDLENRTHHLLSENDNLITQLRDHQTKEFTLTKEMADMRDRYDECINLLNEKQDEIRALKKKIEWMIMKQVQYYRAPSPLEPDNSDRSLAFEIEESCKRGCDELDHSRTMRIMEQARALNTTLIEGDEETSSGFTEDILSSMVPDDVVVSPDQLSGNFLLRRSIQDDCERRRLLRHHGAGNKSGSHHTSNTLTPRSPSIGQDENYLSEALFHRQSSFNGLSSLNTNMISCIDSPTSHSHYKLPDKLQLIKPLEGSHTLRAWQNLAIPSLTKALFEDQPHGVCFRGQQFTNAGARSTSSSTLSSPTSDHGGVRTRTSSVTDDVDYEKPSPVVRTRDQEAHAGTLTYTSSRITHPMTLANVNSPKGITSVHDLQTLSFTSHTNGLDRRSSASSCDPRESTPVNESAQPLSLLPAHYPSSSSSWLDRFAVGSIMTSILGYSRPTSSTATFQSTLAPMPRLNPSPTASQSSSLSSSTAHNESSIIGRLTNLPPLAKRKPIQRPQSGLNLLTSLAPSASMKMAIHRVDSVDDDGDHHTQVD